MPSLSDTVLERRLDAIEDRLDVLDDRCSSLSERVDTIESADAIDVVAPIAERIGAIEKSVAKLRLDVRDGLKALDMRLAAVEHPEMMRDLLTVPPVTPAKPKRCGCDESKALQGRLDALLDLIVVTT